MRFRQIVCSWKDTSKQSRACSGWMITGRWSRAPKTVRSLGVRFFGLIDWFIGDLESQAKLIFRGEKFNRKIQGHFDEVLCCALSPSGKFMVTGGKDRIVRVWDIHNQTQIQSFMGHRDSITVSSPLSQSAVHRMFALTKRTISFIQFRMTDLSKCGTSVKWRIWTRTMATTQTSWT